MTDSHQHPRHVLIQMTKDTFIKRIEQYVQLTDEEMRYAKSVLEPSLIRQNDLLVANGEPCKFMIYVCAGCLMSYYTDSSGNVHVIQFATEGWWTGDLHSFTNYTPSIYSTKALADSEVLLITKPDLDDLFNKVPKFERYFRIIFQNSLVTHQFRIIQNFSSTAEERYLYFQNKYSSLEQFVPLKYIASYLGITPEFLSKVRRKIMEKS
ncbi:MAG TPA: Crp/Fnr family transcriptional regulator [Cyclobacteriaceae bacterium]|nr:Crp/Fnr family transcriptional regulator [Cyclobacteriaceae bacterium]